ncbi:MAG: protein kinase [Planctomycetota bacterium]
MEREAWLRMTRAVEAAADLPPEAADALLAETLGEDPALLEEARAVLAAGREADEFLEASPEGASTALSEAFRPSIDGYELLEVIGHGGMGTVYRARQLNPKRDVALKVLATTVHDASAQARFVREIESLAVLRHPGIAHLHAAGFATDAAGRRVPWFAMEFVPGATPLVQHADARRLDVRGRVRLLASVCEAVRHGHQRGILHRDLKPENLLVDHEGRIKVIDYGVATSLEGAPGAERQTAALHVVGTLPWLSPERVRGEAGDVRADVYALGVVLYELLTGELPIAVDSKDVVGSARRVCEQEPERPSRRRHDLDEDLDAIALTALAKDPEDRYASVDALGEDLQRWLGHLPVRARAPGPWRQLRLFARRHRALVTAAAAIALVTVAAAAISVTWAVRSDESEQKALREQLAAEEARSRQQRLFEALLERNVESTAEAAPRLMASADGAERVKEMLDRVLEDVAVLERIGGSDPRVQTLLVNALLRLGDALGNKNFMHLHKEGEAAVSYDRALAIAERMRRERPDSEEARLLLAQARTKRAQLLFQEAQRAQVRPQLRDPERVERRRALLQAALDDLLGRPGEPANPEADALEVETRATLGRLAIDEKRFEDARAQADAIQRFYDSGRLPREVLGHTLRAWAYYYEKRYAEAVRAWDDAISVHTVLTADPRASFLAYVRLADAWGGRAEAAWFGGDFEGARASFEQAEAVLAPVFEREPDSREAFDRLTLHVMQRMRMDAAWALARPEEAEKARADAVGAAARASDRAKRAAAPSSFATILLKGIAELEAAWSEDADPPSPELEGGHAEGATPSR